MPAAAMPTTSHIITRAGDNTKIVLTGDPSQIDNPYVDATNNGLIHVVNKFRKRPRCVICPSKQTVTIVLPHRLLSHGLALHWKD